MIDKLSVFMGCRSRNNRNREAITGRGRGVESGISWDYLIPASAGSVPGASRITTEVIQLTNDTKPKKEPVKVLRRYPDALGGTSGRRPVFPRSIMICNALSAYHLANAKSTDDKHCFFYICSRIFVVHHYAAFRLEFSTLSV
jgi:hypothetical protein